MFLKNSFTFFFLTLCLFPLAFGKESIRNQKQDTISIPKLNIEKKIKEKKKQILLDTDLDLLNFQDQIIIQREDGTYYYKVIQKSNTFSAPTLLEKENVLVLLSPKKQKTLQTVVLAILTGKLVKSE